MLAGAKSCEVNVNCDDIEIASATSGSWKDRIAGRKDWSLSTSQIQAFGALPTYTIEAVGTSNNGLTTPQSYCTINGSRYAGGTRGLQLRIFAWDSNLARWVAQSATTYDTYATSSLCSDIATVIDEAAAGSLVVITSFDAYSMTSTLASKISTKFNIPLNSIPTVSALRASFVLVGIVGQKGVTFTNADPGNQVHAQLLLDGLRDAMTSSPVKNALLSVSTIYNIQIQVDGLGGDRLTGKALCKQARVTGTQGALMQGAFSFAGCGELK